MIQLRLILAAFIKDNHILKLMADPFHLIGGQMTLNITFAIFVLIGIKVRLIYISSKFFHLILRFRHNFAELYSNSC